MSLSQEQIKRLEKVFDKRTEHPFIHEATIYLETASGDNWARGYNIDENTPYCVASVTKLYTSAAALILAQMGKLSLDTPIKAFFEEEFIKGLHQYKGIDHSLEITVRHLVSHTSGLADYFEEKGANGTSEKEKLLIEDHEVYISDIVNRTKKMKAHFLPGTKNKAYYSDLNFDLLGLIIEKVMDKPLNEVFKALIYEPLGLMDTFIYDGRDQVPVIYYKEKAYYLPKTLKSMGAQGGIITTAKDNMIFLRAYFEHKLFSKELLQEACTFNRLITPGMASLQYGMGVMRFKMSKWLAPIGNVELIGHTGTNAAFAFYIPEKQVFLTGTLNQLCKPSWPYRLAMQMAYCL